MLNRYWILKEILHTTSTNDTSVYTQDHDINSLHELCPIFTKIDLRTEKGLKYVVMLSKFASNLKCQKKLDILANSLVVIMNFELAEF